MSRKWYGISLLFKSIHAKPSKEEPVWQEQIILVRASSTKEAERLAGEYGRSHEVEYDVIDNDSVTWVFDSVRDTYEVDGELASSGTEVFYRFMKESEVRAMDEKFE